MSAVEFAVCFCGLSLALNLGSLVFAMLRLRPPPFAITGSQPPVSIVRPLCGLDNFADETLASTFALAYPSYEILFCVEDADDPAAALARRLMREHPERPSRLLIGSEMINDNPKLNNCLKGWRAARHDWIVLTDSNVMMPPDYLERMFAVWDREAGLVCSTPIGARPASFGAEVECAFLNTFQAKWHYVGESFGFGFAQGKNMLLRRQLLDPHGGLAALGGELAEDAAATKLIRSQGLRVRAGQKTF